MTTLEPIALSKSPANRRPWWILIIPPFLFLSLTVLASLVAGFVSRGDTAAIPEMVSVAVPYILLAGQLALGLLLWRFMRADGLSFGDIGWRPAMGQTWPSELALGLAVALPLTAANQLVLLPALAWLQTHVGDYVPSGAVEQGLGATALVTLLSAVVLAPLVEESLYRGYATRQLSRRYSKAAVFMVVMIFFGLLHWAQGFWPMVYTMMAHIIFGGLAWWRGNLTAAWLTHLSFNAVELALILN